jgi:glycosyltransferase involved in cell wall biosynthesis
VATEIFVDHLAAAAADAGVDLVVRRTSAPPGASRLRHHAERVVRVLRAAGTMAWRRGRLRGVYVSVDAGLGTAYSTVLCALAAALGVPAYAHHHSADYLGDRPARRMAVLCRLGRTTVHLVGGPKMGERLAALYRPAAVEVLPITYAVVPPPAPAPGRSDDAVVLGHMSNLSVDKGLEDVFATAATLSQRGVPVRLVLGGPAFTPADGARLAELQAAAPYPVESRGPVYGPAREAFFAALDVFVFPSRYRHESFGLVVGEALIRGVPAVAMTNLCLTDELVAGAARLVDPAADFAPVAADWIEALARDPAVRAGVKEATARFTETCARDRAGAEARARRMVAGPTG